MESNKLETISNLFEGKEIRSIWDAEKEDYYFSVVDVIKALTDSPDPSHYWRTLKYRMTKEGNETVTNCESVPSNKAKPFKLWLAQMGKERIDEVFDPEIAIKRAIDYYRNRGYSDKWIEARLKGILDRNKLTDVWKENGITESYEFAVLTNEIYKTWSGMKASQYKAYKGIRKESLRDNMSDVEVALTDLGEIATRELAKKHKPYGLKENRKVAKAGGEVAKTARDDLEKKLGETVISKKNALNYKYIEQKVLDRMKDKNDANQKQG